MSRAEQEMLGPDVDLVQPAGLPLGKDHGLPGVPGEPFKHPFCPFAGAARG